jgi:hypothetical protein
MNKLRKAEYLCDVTLKVDQTLFPAHRLVLAAASDYFAAMFTGEVHRYRRASCPRRRDFLFLDGRTTYERDRIERLQCDSDGSLAQFDLRRSSDREQ